MIQARVFPTNHTRQIQFICACPYPSFLLPPVLWNTEWTDLLVGYVLVVHDIQKDKVLLYTYAIDRVCRDHGCSILDIRQRRLSFQKRDRVVFLIHGLVRLIVLVPSQSLCCRVANAINLCCVCCQS